MNAAALRQELAAQHVVLSVSESGRLKYEAPTALPHELVEAMKEHRDELLNNLRTASPPAPQLVIPSHATRTLPRLPGPVASMVAAAASDQIKGGAVLPSGLVTDLGGYVLAWAAAYLTGEPAQALAHLVEARAVWNRA
ncbi:hypothetical protein Q0M94_28035 (plasmid) [Deinococcus radiomollis]|uniref:hypothetical protein n=1 Tax=Deinococcus radiomollis TaxID=468916 RepID=UPI003892C96B